MKTLLITGIVLVVLGAAALAYQGLTYTTEETVLDIGPLEATAERQETIPIPPLIGWALVLGGGAAIVGAVVRGKSR